MMIKLIGASAVLLVVLMAACPLSPAFAEVSPTAAHADYRIKYVAYDPDNVVQLQAVVGLAIHIILSPDETYMTHAFGDPAGWDFAHKDNHYFIKAKAANSDTNLVIVTDQRSYNFVLHFIGNDSAKDATGKPVASPIQTPWASEAATLQVAFTYPEEKVKAAERTAIAKRFTNGRDKSYNLKYAIAAKSQDQEIAPINVWDDGRFTYFKFAQNTDLPNIYTVDAGGQEAIVNRHMLAGDPEHVVVAEKVAQKFVLRLGRDAVGIYNEAFNPAGSPNITQTSSSAVRRRTLSGDHK